MADSTNEETHCLASHFFYKSYAISYTLFPIQIRAWTLLPGSA